MSATTRARTLRKAMSKPEVLLWTRIRGFRALGFHIRRQAPIGPYFADFACHAARLVIEVDGAQHHEPDAQRHDMARNAWLAAQGYETMRLVARDVLRTPDAAADQVLQALKARYTPPAPLRGLPSP